MCLFLMQSLQEIDITVPIHQKIAGRMNGEELGAKIVMAKRSKSSETDIREKGRIRE